MHPNRVMNTERVIRHFIDHPDQPVTLSELTELTLLDRAKVSSAIQTIKRTLAIQIIGKGVYQYCPGKSPAQVSSGHINGASLFETIAMLPDGRVLIKDEDGVAYFATRA